MERDRGFSLLPKRPSDSGSRRFLGASFCAAANWEEIGEMRCKKPFQLGSRTASVPPSKHNNILKKPLPKNDMVLFLIACENHNASVGKDP